MKQNILRIVLMILILTAESNIYSQVAESDDTNKTSWGRSLYFSTGFGAPIGVRFELGYNIETALSLGLTYSKSDGWSSDPSSPKMGITIKSHFLHIESNSIYLLLNYAGTFALFGDPDTYTLVHIGSKIPLTGGLQLCPEFGWMKTSKYLGSSSFWGSSEPVRNKTNSGFGIIVSLEIDFAHL